MRQLLFILLLFSNTFFAQNTIKGYVKDNNSKLALSGANVFVANSLISTITDENGYFELNLNVSNVEVIVSFVGYQTANFNIDKEFEFVSKKLIYLNEINTELNEVVINFSKVKNKKNALKRFIYYFVGNSELASSVKISNPDDIEFREQILPDNYKLIAFANKPIELINKKLGYKIKYELIDFEYNHDHAHVNLYSLYNGHALFIDIIDELKLNREKVEKERLNAYQGSITHFIRSLYNKNYETEGFKIMKLKTEENKLYNANGESNSNQPQFNIIITDLHKNDTIILEENNSKFLTFKDYLRIKYLNKKEEYNYSISHGGDRKNYQSSELQLKDDKIEIFKNGNFFPSNKMIMFGHLSWQKMGDMLPFDYHP